jgi:hypothetical protein
MVAHSVPKGCMFYMGTFLAPLESCKQKLHTVTQQREALTPHPWQCFVPLPWLLAMWQLWRCMPCHGGSACACTLL